MSMRKMKDECQGVANGLIEELEKVFLDHEIMIVLSVIYSWYWVTNSKEVEDKFFFFFHMGMLKATLNALQKVGESN
jgi:hypothetical protein